MQTAEEIDDLFLGDAEVSFLLMDITILSNFTLLLPSGIAWFYYLPM